MNTVDSLVSSTLGNVEYEKATVLSGSTILKLDASAVSANSSPAQVLSPNATVTTPQTIQGSGGMSFDQVQNVWIQAGGNPQASEMAAAVADASSGLNPGAKYTDPDGTVALGLWLIPQNGMPPGSTDPVANARAAVQLSKNGTDWKFWCVAWSDNNCGQQGGTYLGDGSNALGSLAQTGSSSVAGATPTGTGTSAGTASSTSSLSKILPFIIIAAAIGAIWWFN